MKKFQNIGKDTLVERVSRIQKSGLMVYGGFIIGLDSDSEDIFDRQIEFITEAAIPNAQVAPLMALPGTPLYKRMKSEGRLLETGTDDLNRTIASGYTNIITKIPQDKLLEGHLKIIKSIFSPRAYFERVMSSLLISRSSSVVRQYYRVAAFILQFLTLKKINLGGKSSGSLNRWAVLHRVFQELPKEFTRECLKLIFRVLLRCPDQLPRLLPLILMGVHFYRFTREFMIPGLEKFIAETKAEAAALTPPKRQIPLSQAA
jgi:hypothetical protein